MEIQGVEIIEVGTWNGREFSATDLDGMAASFQALNLGGRIPLKFGHEGDDARDDKPALGWVTRVYREGQKLLADFASIPKAVYDAIKSGAWKFVSVELLRDVQAGTRKIPWVLDAVALLGATQPAVGTLKDLQALTMSSRPTFQFAERMAFNRESDELATLRARNVALARQLLDQAIETDVQSGRVWPREREMFKRKFGDAGTVADWAAWVASTPRPPSSSGPRTRQGEGGDGLHVGEGPPDEQMVRLTHELIETERDKGRTVSYTDAARIVMRRNPELARSWVLSNGSD